MGAHERRAGQAAGARDRAGPGHDLPPAAHDGARRLRAQTRRRHVRPRGEAGRAARRKPRSGGAQQDPSHAHGAAGWSVGGGLPDLLRDGEIRGRGDRGRSEGSRVDLWVGFEDAGHATALGKCVLRELDGEARADYLSRHR
ncbi:hypothetical protein LV779_12440 [Streptomyces thinghirensis]|nr:hypothetical protein [Streptomyces thinghirensis]